MPPGAYIDSQDAWGWVDTAAGPLNQGCSTTSPVLNWLSTCKQLKFTAMEFGGLSQADLFTLLTFAASLFSLLAVVSFYWIQRRKKMKKEMVFVEDMPHVVLAWF